MWVSERRSSLGRTWGRNRSGVYTKRMESQVVALLPDPRVELCIPQHFIQRLATASEVLQGCSCLQSFKTDAGLPTLPVSLTCRRR